MTEKLHPLLVSLRSAYEAHNRLIFEDLLRRVNAKLMPPVPPQTQLAPCARGQACVCATLEQRMSCTYVSARPRGDL